MKKIIALALVVVMLCSMTTLLASAADLTPSKQSESITISYGSEEYYEITIPSNVTLGDLDAYVVTTGVKVENVSLLPTNKLKVTAESANNFKVNLKGTSHNIPYTMKYGANNTEVSTADTPIILIDIFSGVDSASCPIAFKRTGNAAVSGSYTDTFTFTATIYQP